MIKELFCKKCGKKIGRFKFEPKDGIKDVELEAQHKECK